MPDLETARRIAELEKEVRLYKAAYCAAEDALDCDGDTSIPQYKRATEALAAHLRAKREGR